jgi:hypothetical protein
MRSLRPLIGSPRNGWSTFFLVVTATASLAIAGCGSKHDFIFGNGGDLGPMDAGPDQSAGSTGATTGSTASNGGSDGSGGGSAGATTAGGSTGSTGAATTASSGGTSTGGSGATTSAGQSDGGDQSDALADVASMDVSVESGYRWRAAVPPATAAAPAIRA